MPAISLQEIADNLFCLDLRYNEMERHSSAYIVRDSNTALIETGATRSVPLILEALDALDIKRDDIEYVLVTHVHLDHAGGAGTALKEFPRARLVVHQAGARHMIDPEKLATSARNVYGERFDRLFGDMVPVPAERVVAVHERTKLELGKRTLEIFDAPGHAYHHMIINSPLDRGIFTGDAGGLLFPAFGYRGFEYSLISTSPTQFDPSLMKKTLALMQSLMPRQLYYTHFGASSQADTHLARAAELVDTYVAMAATLEARDSSLPSLVSRLRHFHQRELAEKGIDRNDPLLALLENDLELNAQGLLYYAKKKEKERAAL